MFKLSSKGLSMLFYTLVFIGFCAKVKAQGKTVAGSISAGDGTALPGVTILIQGTSQGTITDIDGKYSIDVGGMKDPSLVFSFIGFQTQVIQLGDRTTIDVTLAEDMETLEEVVVVGYGVQQKKLTTGATGQVKGDKLLQLSNTDALTALQGQVAGVNISATSGQPGENQRVNIRGLGTIGNSGPLYVVDGMQTGDISYLNNADIASIDILKDAASAAIYGSQAANGVILITTKTGKKGDARWNFDSYYGVQEPIHQIRMLNSREYATIMNEAAINSGDTPFFSADTLAQLGSGTDWIDEMIFSQAVTQNYSLGVSGGSDKSVYSASMAYTEQEGMVGGPDISTYERYSFRVNTEHSLLDGLLTFGQHLTFSHARQNGIDVGNQYNNSLRGAFNTSPLLPMFDDQGNFLDNTPGANSMINGNPWTPWNEGESNPYAEMVLDNQNDNKNQKMLGDFYFELNPVKNLRVRTRFGYDYYASQRRSYSPAYQLSLFSQQAFDEASQDMSQGLALTWDNTITYEMAFDRHHLTAMVGSYSWKNNSSGLNVKNANLTISDLDHAYIDNTTNTDLVRLGFGGAPNDEDKLLSYFGRLSYDFQDKYILNVTFRADGSSRFAKNNRWGYFPSVSAGWVLSNEAFWSALDQVSYLKLRGSWGQVGNQNISAFQYLAPVQVGEADYYFGSADFDAAANSVGAFPNRLPNPDIKWETSEQLNIGLDAYLLDTRLEVNLDWYQKTTKDWLLEKPGFATEGADPPFFNGGTVENKGVELLLNWRDDIGDLAYFVTFTGADNSNKVTEVPTEEGIVPGLENMLFDNSPMFYRRAETGLPIGYFWGYRSLGVFQNEEQVVQYTNSEGVPIQPGAVPGDLIFADLNDDGVIDDADKNMIGDPNPDLTYSVSFGFNYKGFDFSVLGYGVAGNQIVQSYRNHSNPRANYTRAILDRWHGAGTSNTLPRVTLGNVNYQHLSDVFVQNGDFFRLNNITLGYDFAKFISKKAFSKLRLYASVLNAHTFTSYDGMDPEVGYGFDEDNTPDGSSGVDLGFYPRPRTYLLGVNVGF